MTHPILKVRPFTTAILLIYMISLVFFLSRSRLHPAAEHPCKTTKTAAIAFYYRHDRQRRRGAGTE
jgi:hypothetical protein